MSYVIKRTHTQPQSGARGRLPATHTGVFAMCGYDAYISKPEEGGALVGEYAYIRCTSSLRIFGVF
jgi:hypothetical protein